LSSEGVCYLLLSHLPPEQTEGLLTRWRRYCQPPSQLVLCYGGTAENFAKISYAPKIFIEDPRLRTRHHQREKQSYSQIYQKVARWLGDHPECGYVYFAEFDHWPLVENLGERLIERLKREGADVLGHELARRDKTCCGHYLYHLSDERFLPWLKSVSCRPDPGVVFNMFGSGSFWTREAFLAVAESGEPFPVYLEVFLPTLAHHLGFRVRDFQEQSRYVRAVGNGFEEIGEAARSGAWTIHPIKAFSPEQLKA
jgi:hypothetical protein